MNLVHHGGPQVIFSVPSYAHNVKINFHRSWTETIWELTRHGISAGTMVRPGDAFVDKARNKLVTDFLRDFPDTENFFFLDDDIGWPAEKVVEFIMRPDDIVCGVYPKKSEQTDWPVSFVMNQETGDLIESEGLMLAAMAPTGFMRIKRRVLEKLAENANIFTDRNPDDSLGEYAYIFESGRGPDGNYWGEDYTFCKKAQDAGFHVWIDPNIKFTHVGVKTWEGKVADHLHVFRARAKAMFEGNFNHDTNQINDVLGVLSSSVNKLWVQKALNSEALKADPLHRAELADIDDAFWPLYDKVHDLTMTPPARLFDLYKTVEYIVKANIPGTICECGVWKGGSMMMVALALQAFGDTGRKLQLFDTFEGLPIPDPELDIDIFGKKQWMPELAKGALWEVQANMAGTGYPQENVSFVVGKVEETLKEHADPQYALVRLDTDWYESTKCELEVLWDRIVPGGVLVIDDFGHWLGCRQACEEFFDNKAVRITRVDYSCRVIQKTGVAVEGWLREAAE